MDTTVTLQRSIDFGAGDTTHLTIPDSKAKTDPAGNLIVFSEQRGEEGGSVMFHRDEWKYVVSGDLTFRVQDGGQILVRRHRAPMGGQS